jgi:DMSO/TMAO reductase YedYZ molybdopterin-dependent catalytic subunit
MGCVRELGQGRSTTHWPTPNAPLTPVEDWYFFAIQGAYEADLEGYRLFVDGLVREPLSLSIGQLRGELSAVEEVLTLACVGNSPGGGLMSAGRFRGVPLEAVLELAGASARANFAVVTGLDGYVGVLSLAEARSRGAMLAYDMGTSAEDLAPLPIDHGFPLRVLVPGLYGYPQPKWIDAITLVESASYEVTHGAVGYAHARMMLASGFSRPRDGATVSAGEREVIGFAFGDGRPIARVEVRIDGGDWVDAEIVYNGLDDDLPAHLWVLWRLSWLATPGRHELSCRATYDDGEGQIEGHAFPYSGGSIEVIGVEVAG